MMMGSEGSELIARLDAVLEASVTRLEESRFYRDITAGERVRALYVAYLQEAYQYVRLTASFTPLAARRMDPELLGLRQWILHHSADEMGHELMALKDLEILGRPKDQVRASTPLPGTWAWVQFFHYQVTQRPPFAAMGVLYFLEGMAAKLAPIVSSKVLGALEGREKKAITFFREHGTLDTAHTAEQRDMLAKFCKRSEDQEVVSETIVLASHIKRYMLDELVAAQE
jgi:pyrroloquinoline quinone (PQQ) biosynthesis protein C